MALVNRLEGGVARLSRRAIPDKLISKPLGCSTSNAEGISGESTSSSRSNSGRSRSLGDSGVEARASFFVLGFSFLVVRLRGCEALSREALSREARGHRRPPSDLLSRAVVVLG